MGVLKAPLNLASYKKRTILDLFTNPGKPGKSRKIIYHLNFQKISPNTHFDRNRDLTKHSQCPLKQIRIVFFYLNYFPSTPSHWQYFCCPLLPLSRMRQTIINSDSVSGSCCLLGKVFNFTSSEWYDISPPEATSSLKIQRPSIIKYAPLRQQGMCPICAK